MSEARVLFIKRYSDQYIIPKFFWFDIEEKDVYNNTLWKKFLEGLRKEGLLKRGGFLMVKFYPSGVVILGLRNVEKIRRYDTFFSSGKPIYWINNKELNIITNVRKRLMKE